MLTARKLWAGLSQEGRGKVCADLARCWRQLEKGSRKALAQAISFRERTFETTELERRAKLLRQAIPRLGHRDLHILLVYLTKIREELATDFKKVTSRLDTSNVSEDIEEKIKNSIDRLRGRWALEDIWLHVGIEYVRILQSKDTSLERYEKIFKVLEEAHVSQISASYFFSEEDTEATTSSANKVKKDFPEFNSPDFTTLDNVLIRTIMSSLNRVEGVLNFDELDDLVGELSELNDSRERSWFHRGFVDCLLERELQAAKSGDNVSRRTWYVTGNLVASMRALPESNRPALIKALAPRDVELLKDPSNESAVQFLSLLLKPLLEQGEVEEANDWIAAHGEKKLKNIVEIVREWAKSALFIQENDPGKVRSVLDTIGKFFKEDIRNSRANMENIMPENLHSMDWEIRYLRAVSFRMEGQFKLADNEFKNLIDKEEPSARKKDLWVQRALVDIGIRRLGHLHIPPAKKERETFVQGILSAKNWLEKAVEGDSPSPIALVLMALPEVVFPQESENEGAKKAKDRLNRAIDIMQPPGVQLWESGEGSLGEETHLLTKARFYSTLLDLRTLEAVQAEGNSLVTRLQKLFQDDKFPPDLEIEAVYNALLIDAPGVAELAANMLNRHGHEALRVLDIVEASKKSKYFRTSLIDMLENSKWQQKLKPVERWNAWKSLLQGCIWSDVRDSEHAEHALDSLQTLAHDSSKSSGKFVKLLQDPKDELWSPTWEEEDRDDALYDCFIRLNDITQVVNVLVKMTHREISNQCWQEVDELLKLLKRHDSDGNSWQQLKKRRDDTYAEDDPTSNAVDFGIRDTREISIIFIGGDERQRRYVSILSEQFKKEDPCINVSYHFTDWSSNWPKTVGKISNELREADAMVLMRFMRTGLGRRLRPLADKHGTFWTPCTGSGRDSMKRSILEAARIVRQQRQQDMR